MTKTTAIQSRSINQKWEEYRTAVLAGGRRFDMGLAELLFYGGATAAISSVETLFKADIPADKVVEGLEELCEEVLHHEFAPPKIQV